MVLGMADEGLYSIWSSVSCVCEGNSDLIIGFRGEGVPSGNSEQGTDGVSLEPHSWGHDKA